MGSILERCWANVYSMPVCPLSTFVRSYAESAISLRVVRPDLSSSLSMRDVPSAYGLECSAVVVAQLAEWSLLTPEIPSSIPNIR